MFRGRAEAAAPWLKWIISGSKYSLWGKQHGAAAAWLVGASDQTKPLQSLQASGGDPRRQNTKPCIPISMQMCSAVTISVCLFSLQKQTRQIPSDLLPSRLKSQRAFVSLCSPTWFCNTTTQKHQDAGRNSQSPHRQIRRHRVGSEFWK